MSSSLGKGRGDPNRIGERTLLAKTCSSCGRLLSAHYFGRNEKKKTGAIYWRSHCYECLSRRTASIRDTRHDLVSRARKDMAQGETLPVAQNHSKHWTEQDLLMLEKCAMEGKTTRETALILGRSFYAVQNKYAKVRQMLKEKEAGQWVIRF